MEIEIYCDGGARGNPGPAAAGIVIKQSSNQAIKRIGKYLGPNLTNNQAEYLATIEGLKAAKKYKPDKVTVFVDSKLAVEQLNLRYKLKNAGLKKLFDQVMSLKLSFPVVEFKYIPREKNKEADMLVNEILNSKFKLQSSKLSSKLKVSATLGF